MVWLAAGLVGLAALACVLLAVAARQAEPYLRARLVEAIADRFHARVELDGFHISLQDGLAAEGVGLRIWPPDGAPAATGQPLIRLDRFRFRAPLTLSPGAPIHISVVQLEGLVVDLPPHAHFLRAAQQETRKRLPGWARFTVDRVECARGRLIVETTKPGKLPQEYAISRLAVTRSGAGLPLGFEAELQIPKPQGTVKTRGSFGPWTTGDPGESPIAGDYRLVHADLGVFHGIGGVLDSTGRFKGSLRDLAVDGETRTPDFRLTHFGQPMGLKTRFHAHVDGTNGDTWLEPVEATLGGSHFTAKGSIVRVPGALEAGAQQPGGHDIALEIQVDRARIEDFLRLTSKTGNVVLTGDVTSKAALDIPPGTEPLHERMRLKGDFTLDHAQFVNPAIQNRIAELSLRGQGRPDAVKTTDPRTIQATLEGEFTQANGSIRLPRLDFTVPGAAIVLSGTYGLDGGKLDFTGDARLTATVSKVVGGWQGMLLSPLNGFFRKKGAGTLVPIHIGGTREHPDFGVDFGKLM